MKRYFPILTAMVLLVVTGVVHGLWTDRWRLSNDLEVAVARLDKMPTDLGDWRCDTLNIDPKSLKQAGAEGHWVHTYVNRRTGQSVMVILLCGRADRMSVHRPENCYQGAGYEMVGSPGHYILKSDNADFLTARFYKEEALRADSLRIYWSWFSNGSWQAPENPRWAFSPSYQPLYKLYVANALGSDKDSPDKGAAVDLMRLLMPALTHALTSSPE